MLNKWEAIGRIAVLVAGVTLLCLQAPLLVTGHDMAVGLAILLATTHAGAAPLALWQPVIAAVLSVIATAARMLAVMTDDVGTWPWAVVPMITQLLVLAVLVLVAGWRVAATTLAVLVAGSLAFAVIGLPWHGLAATLADVSLFASLALLLGALVAVGGRLLEIREALFAERQISAEEHARRMLVEEKSRVARELHDVIAHTMSLITVQSRSAPHRLPGVDEATAAEFEQIADRTADALNQMRGVLGVLRTEPDQSGRVPVPRLAEVPALLEAARETGQRVAVLGDLPGDTDVDEDTGAAAYRILQESLSNARRHAGQRPVTVAIDLQEEDLVLRISNPLDARTPSSPDGHGLVGMRERAAAVGGRLAAGELEPGEYVVEARLRRRHRATHAAGEANGSGAGRSSGEVGQQ